MRNRLLLTFAAAALLFVPAGIQAQSTAWTIDPAHSSVNFTVRHLGVSNVHGSLMGVKGTIQFNDKDITKSSVDATIDTTTVSTGVEARDKHLKSPDFFEVDKYPTLAFKSTSLTKNGDKLQLSGDLTLHGVTKPITFELDGPAPPQTGKDGKTRSGFSAEGTLKRSDFSFGSKFPSAMVGDDIKFSIDVEIDKQ
jgi:polyisoprenoid-binding protein YceI